MVNSKQDWLIVADGEPLSKTRLSALAENRRVLALDGAFYQAQAANLKIEILLGDFDSIQPLTLAEARKTIKIIEAPNQNKTDLEKGIEYLDSIQAHNIAIAAATEKRLQHTLYNLRLLKKYYCKTRPLTIYSEREIVSYHQNQEITIKGNINDCIAILGFPEAVITTSGLQYDVTDYVMQFEKNNSISNALSANHATIQIQGGILLIHEHRKGSSAITEQV